MAAPTPRPPDPAGPGARPPAVVVGHGPRTDLWVVATVFPGGIALLLLGGWLALPKFGPAIGGSGAVAVVAGVFLLATWGWLGQGTEQVVLTPQGIQRRGRWLATPRLFDHGPLVRWEWLDPAVRGPVRLGFAYFRWHRPGGYLEWFRLPVTPTQAAAIRAHPRCPTASPAPDGPLR